MCNVSMARSAPPTPRTRRNALRSHWEAPYPVLSYPQGPLALACFLLFALSEVGDDPTVPHRLSQVSRFPRRVWLDSCIVDPSKAPRMSQMYYFCLLNGCWCLEPRVACSIH